MRRRGGTDLLGSGKLKRNYNDDKGRGGERERWKGVKIE